MRSRMIALLLGSFIVGGSAESAFAQAAQRRGLRLKDLPASVQKTVSENLNGGEIKHIGRETENGVQQYEIESVLNGKTRDFNVDTHGTLLEVEEATTIDAIPSAAKAGIMNRVGRGRLTRVEVITKPGRAPLFEAGYIDAKGKTREIQVEADGSAVKE